MKVRLRGRTVRKRMCVKVLSYLDIVYVIFTKVARKLIAAPELEAGFVQ